MNDDAMDLRTRNRRATREAIGNAALRLAIEQGPHGLALVRVADIAEAAGVSPRTYNNYFSSREEAICALQADQARRLGEALRARPATEPFDQAVVAAVIELYTGPEPDRAGLRMIMQTPELEGEALKAFTMAEPPLTEAIAARTGTDPARDLFPAVTAAAVAGAIRVAGRHWLSPGTAESFADILRTALSHVLSPEKPDDTEQ
ncbi:TetR/AcrR family transcriptional regulator [Sphaerisporangium rubeum]|uniref:AcrR family transcriptional regulator n=1 Tax=Sphaerisporangium rubeum TaxID=321317 RepID=A0A7X0IBY8_9ACTN|nr:TetR/AcrR family transcriptional regulator [Sphaerisporangium rubeum]MBB6470862.1 AcrR family transcriptional regulator [Sphaerisporangium rubeum]